MSPQFKEFMQRNLEYIDSEGFDKLVCTELIENEWLDELLDVLYKSGGLISPTIVTDKLIDFYIKNNSRLTKSQKENLEVKIRYLVNKHQVALIKTIIAEQW